MFKLLLLAAVVAATPVIELQLDQAGLRKAGRTFRSERTANTQWVHHCAAKTGAGNKADQVIFAIILDDQTKPVFNFGQKYTRECQRTVTVNVPKPTASDNIDGNVAVRINGKDNVRQSIGH